MKLTALAAALALLQAALPAFSQQLAPEAPSKEKTELFNDIEAWRATQLPHLTPPVPLTAKLEPRLDEIKAEVKAAQADSELAKPRKELAAWKKELLRQKFELARSQGLTHGTLADYSGEQNLQAEFSATLHSLLAQDVVQRELVQTQQRALSAGVQNPTVFFDGGRIGGGQPSRVQADPTVVSAPTPAGPNSPERYAKVRQILISQGAKASVIDLAINEAIRQNADPLLVLAVINSESGFHTHATSSCGARGLMQIMPDTGRGLGVRDSGMLYDAQTNLQAGIRFLKSLCGQFAGGEMNPFNSHSVKSAVAAYNAGPGAVRKYDGVPPYRETQGYVKNVLGYYAQLKQYLTA